jgi:hypothetical protein
MKSAINVVPRPRLLVAVCTAIALVAAFEPYMASAQQPLPAGAKFRGKSLVEWSFLQNEWRIATGLGGQSLPDTIQKTRLVPGPFSPDDVEFDVEVSPGTALVLPPFFAFGELYDDGSFDDPNDPFLASIIDQVYNETELTVSLDGNVVLSGTPAELGAYAYGFDEPLYFDEPIVYDEPIDKGGGLFSVAALWTLGVGAVFHPLPPGEHTIQVVQDGPIFGHIDTLYNISVLTPSGAHVPEPAAAALVALTAPLWRARRRIRR